MWRRWLEARADAAWYGGAWWSILLVPLSGVVALLVRWRRHRFLARTPPSKPFLPVIVVGGLTAGGTGKSPVLMALARVLGDQYRVAVVSRGYGGHRHERPHLVDPQADTASLVGDEPLMIARVLGTPVMVCRDRSLAVAELSERRGADVILADDGLQHYQMARDYEVLVTDAERGFGNRRLLPAGPLREPVDRVHSVDWVLERNGQEPETAFSYRIVGVRRAGTADLIDFAQQRLCWSGAALTALTGLGQPEQFFSMLRREGLSMATMSLGDHAAIRTEDLAAVSSAVILITAKDEVKLETVSDPRLWVVDVVAELPDALVRSVRRKLEVIGEKSR